MGGTTFFITAAGKDAREAFQSARDQALYESGHGGYTGTIAEKPSFTYIHHPDIKDRLPTVAEVSELSERLIGADDRRIEDKWGPAGCTEVTTQHPQGTKRWFAFYGWASC